MNRKEFEEVLRHGETSTVEFKRCGGNPTPDVFETICSFANHAGGSVYLGVLDDGSVAGVPAEAAASIERNIANVAGNPNSFSPTLLVETERFEYDGKTVIRVWVPMNSSVFRYKGQVWDRAADADKRIDGEMQITQMYIRKQNIFTERRICPGLTPADLDPGLLERIRRMAGMKNVDHPWLGMDDDALLHSARLYTRDYGGGTEGLNLAAVLLAGRDDVIADMLPAYGVDAVVRRDDTDRYDDRLTVRTNLIDAYDLLAAFLRKALPDRFRLDGDVAVSPRDRIIRELVSNVLVHREYSSPVPAQITVTGDGVETRNASRPAFEGSLDLGSFTPVPKNPIIADVFTQIGLAEELGSGVRNLVKYTRMYSGGTPSFRDGLVFTAFVPTRPVAHGAGDDGHADIAVAVAALFKDNREITTAQVAESTGESVRAVRRWLAARVRDGKLVAVGQTRNRRYRIA